MKERIRPKPTLSLFIVGLLVGVFILDCTTALGLAVWVLYCAPVILSLQSGRSEVPLAIAIAASLLIFLGYFISQPAPDDIQHLAPLNRGLTVAMLGLLGVFGKRYVDATLMLVRADWIKEGETKVNAAMLGNLATEELARRALDAICDYLGALAACLYVRRLDDGALVPAAAIAAAKNGRTPRTLEEETLVGQAASDRSLLVVEDVPKDYLPIRSGLGQTDPRAIALVPLVAWDEVVGVMELGFLRSLSPADRLLLETVAEPIGISLRGAQSQERQKELLEETQRQAEELLTQQQELRAAN